MGRTPAPEARLHGRVVTHGSRRSLHRVERELKTYAQAHLLRRAQEGPLVHREEGHRDEEAAPRPGRYGGTAPAPRRARASSSSSHVGGREWRAPRDERGTARPTAVATSAATTAPRSPVTTAATGATVPRTTVTTAAAAPRSPVDSRDDRGSRPERGGYQGRDTAPRSTVTTVAAARTVRRSTVTTAAAARPFTRDDRRDDRGAGSSDRGGYQRRDDRPSFNRDDRGSRPERGGYQGRDARPSFDRDDRGICSDRPTFNRDDRGSRPSFNRDDRGSRPSFNRDDRRDDRGSRPSFNRDDRGPARPRGFSRNDRFDRNDRPPSPRTSFGQDAEAERMDADTWTKSTRADVSDGPVEVAADNGFAALGLPERLVERLAREGITTPFPIQAATIPDALAGKDVLGRGQTGSGKTLAFGLPLIARLLEAGCSAAPREAARADPDPDPRARDADLRRARAPRARRRPAPQARRRRPELHDADQRPQQGRRHPHRHPGPAQRPARAGCGRDGRHLDHGARRGRPHGRDGLHGRDHHQPRPDPEGRPAPALLRDARQRRSTRSSPSTSPTR